MKNKWLVGWLVFLVLAGAGCVWFSKNSDKLKDILPAGPRPADLEGVSPEEASKRINFVPGSQIEIGQLGATQDASDKSGVRIVTMQRFAPMVYTNVSWKLRTDSDVSKDENPIPTSTQGKIIAIPPEATESTGQDQEDQTALGVLEGFDLRKTHSIYPPAYWPNSKSDSKGTSGIWLSEDAYEQLKKTGVATVLFGYTDQNLYGQLKSDRSFASGIKSLNEAAVAASKTQEVDLVKTEDGDSDWTLKVNGKDVKIRVIKAKGWFGEIVVLDNPQNPLILKMTFDPAWSGETKGMLSALLGFQVNALEGVQ